MNGFGKTPRLAAVTMLSFAIGPVYWAVIHWMVIEQVADWFWRTRLTVQVISPSISNRVSNSRLRGPMATD